MGEEIDFQRSSLSFNKQNGQVGNKKKEYLIHLASWTLALDRLKLSTITR